MFVSSNSNNVIPFAWNTSNGLAPFTPKVYSIDKLKEALNHNEYGCGVSSIFKESFLKVTY